MSEETTQQMNELAGGLTTPVERSQFMPAMSIELAVERYNTITEFVSRVLRRDVDYGVIPGTDKLTLLKPGAEKLTTFFGLSTRFQLIERVEDWTGDDYQGEPFFYYLYRCQLFRGDLLIAEADGSCNSREQKYRWREQQRSCPACGQAAIIKGKEEYGGGWLCFKKKGGCGAKFNNGDPSIEGQAVGRVPNPEIADQVNTIQKMGQKRALVAATLMAVNASEFFTQDMEDMIIPTGAAAVVVNTPSSVAGSFADEAADLSAEILNACRSLGKTEDQLVDWLGKKYQAGSIASLTPLQQREVLSFLRQKIAKQAA
ncbi:MAG: hypothetical protein QOD00_4082 [Blastocatellia bacterium]|jgi:hypothetical protein|nr:hypothetical protein [Blastocatellia bacterium]